MNRVLLCAMLLATASDAAAQRTAVAATTAVPPSRAADTVTVQSELLGQARRAFISLPASHAATTRAYPVIVVLDGEASFRSAATVSQELARLGHIPEAIVVAIPNASNDPRDRVRDMTPPGLSVSGSSRNEGGDRFLDFIERELLPLVGDTLRYAFQVNLLEQVKRDVIAAATAATSGRKSPAVCGTRTRRAPVAPSV